MIRGYEPNAERWLRIQEWIGCSMWHAMGDMERVTSCGRHMARDKQMGGAQ